MTDWDALRSTLEEMALQEHRWSPSSRFEKDWVSEKISYLIRDEGMERNQAVATAMAMGRNQFAKGGPGSGNFGHSGRPGQIGGSGAAAGLLDAIAAEPKTVKVPSRDGKTFDAKLHAVSGSIGVARKVDFPSSKLQEPSEAKGRWGVYHIASGQVFPGTAKTKAGAIEYMNRLTALGVDFKDPKQFTKDPAIAPKVVDMVRDLKLQGILE